MIQPAASSPNTSNYCKKRRKLAAEDVLIDYEVRPAFTLKVADTFGAVAIRVGRRVSNEKSRSMPLQPATRRPRKRGDCWRCAIASGSATTSGACRCANAGKVFRPVGRYSAAGHAVPAIARSFEPQAARTATVSGEQRPYWSLTTWMAPAGTCYLPATVVPVGRLSNGLPMGIQIVTAYLEDRTTLDIAKRLSTMLGGCPRPEGF